jgi:type VI protein secretion system component Hcp
MKAILCSLLLAIAASVSALAQSQPISVNLTGASTCTFSATSVTWNASTQIVATATGLSAPYAPNKNLILEKTLDNCSSDMAKAAFRGGIYTVTIRVLKPGTTTVARTINLGHAWISSISSDWSKASSTDHEPLETVQFKFSFIQTAP